MELKAIERLLEKYLEAETSVQEEAELKAYFASKEVAPHLQEYAPMFAYLGTSREERYSGELLLNMEHGKDQQVKNIFRLNLSKNLRRKVFSWVAVAAIIMIMAGVFYYENMEINQLGSYEDPKVAMEETKKALDMVSQLMNSGNDKLGLLNEFNITKDKILK